MFNFAKKGFSLLQSEQRLNEMAEGIVEEVVCQQREWRVYFSATYWSARSIKPTTLMPGDSVHVVGRDNITLLIEPIPETPS